MINRYGDVIDSVFFGKLKTALVIDDEYPTMDQLASIEVQPTIMNDEVSTRLASLMSSLRAVEPPLLVDFHDGQTDTDAEIVERFYQSDFLVLDWQLTQTAPKYGPSLHILRQILENGYFNIVVIDSTEDSDKIWSRILRTFSRTMTSIAPETIDDNELPDGVDLDTIERFLIDTDIGDFLLGRAKTTEIEKLVQNIVSESPSEFVALVDIAGTDRETVKQAITYVVSEQIQGFQADKTNGQFSLEGRFDRSNSCGYIKTDGAFISITFKEDDQNPVDVAKRTMKSAGFRPEELMLAGLRDEIAEKGVQNLAQETDYSHASALWYYRLLIADKTRDVLLDSFVSSHADAMIEVVKPAVIATGQKLVESDIDAIRCNADAHAIYKEEAGAYHRDLAANGGEESDGMNKPEPVIKLKPEMICEEHYAVTLEDETEVALAVDQHNFLANCRPVLGTHLTSGHIFKLDDEYWVCVTPVCTMVPGRSPSSQARLTDHRLVYGGVSSSGDQSLPIRMECLKLHLIPEDMKKSFRKKSGQKYFVIIEEDENLVMLGVKKDAGDTTKMQMETFHVDQDSWETNNDKSTVELWLSHIHTPKMNSSDDEGNSEAVDDVQEVESSLAKYFAEKKRVTIVGELRPEYAASLSRRVAAQSSEIGLDYLSPNKDLW